MSYSIKELREKEDEELIRLHDELARSTIAGVSYYLDELHRREQGKQTKVMLKYTKWITIMTLAVTIMTLAIIIVTIVTNLKILKFILEVSFALYL